MFLSSYRPELYRCCLCWRDDVTLLIGWADMVQVETRSYLCSGLKHSLVCSFMNLVIYLVNMLSLLLFVSGCLSVFLSHGIIFPQICVVKERLVQRSDLPPLVVEIGKHQLLFW